MAERDSSSAATPNDLGIASTLSARPLLLCYFEIADHSEAVGPSTSKFIEQRSALYDRSWRVGENAYRPYWRDRPWCNGFLLPALDFDVRQEERDAGADHCACRHANAPEQSDQE